MPANFTEQLLDLARLQAGGDVTSKADVPSLARELLADYLPRAAAKGIDLGLEEQASFALEAPPGALRLIVGNALDNALKYTPAGGSVTLRLEIAEGQAIIEVADTGMGIPESERERLFDPFYRIPCSVDIGSGLGLSIVTRGVISGY